MKRALVLLVLAGAAMTPPQGTIRIVSPVEADYLSGQVTIDVAVDPKGDAIASLVIQVDGQQVCRLTAAPFRCTWNAGAIVRTRHVRAVATFASGARSVANVRTADVDVSEGVAVKSVLVGASVTDWRGRPVQHLTKDAFQLTVGGKEQPISFFATEEWPLDVLVALDISGSMAGHLPKVRQAVRTFVEALRPKDTLTLAAFNTGLFVLAPRAAPGPAHIRAAEKMASWGGTAFYDAILDGLEMFEDGEGRRILIIFTDGEDRLSQTSPEAAERSLLGKDVVLYVVGHGAARQQPLKEKLESLSERTGGRAIMVGDLSDLREAFIELVRDLKTQYTLGFTPDANAKGWQPIVVKLRRNGETIRARQGYVADR